MVPERDREAMRASFEAMMAGARGPVRQHEDTTLAKDGRPVVIAWQHQVLGDEDGRPTGLMSSGLDVTERRAAEDEIAYLAYHDPLTGLPNRSLLQEHLDVALARARRQGTAVALLYLDLDDFKLVNDSLGHAAGDRLLTKVALRLANRHRTSDVLARQGGDEFLLLLSDLPPDEAEAVARTTAGALVASLQMPFVIGGAEFHIGASVGISLFPRDAEDAETLLGHADAAMYQAKAAGRDEVRAFHPERGEPLRRLSMTSRLRAAMDADELVVHWQPIVDPATGSLESLEALVRWQDPLRGLVLPGEFVPFAEETGLIRRLGEHVLTLICRQRREWSADGLYPHVTMNVSARQLEPSFPPLVRAVHEEFGVDPAGLTIEITETAAMQEGPRVEQVLADVADSGVQIAIDDFGAGYSSLSRLRRLPVAMLKIDRQFLADAPSEPAAAAIVTAVLELSEALGMKTVAEGVEAEDQRRFLVGLNCPLAQGFLLGRPVPADEVTAMLRRDAVAGRH
jgi:diguanylate cyclase (GGDEF)-like protein